LSYLADAQTDKQSLAKT